MGPIEGSEINSLAKLYKMYEPVKTAVFDDKTVEYQGKHYRTYWSFPWTDASEKDLKREQYLDGGVLKTGDRIIKYRGTWEPVENSPQEPEHYDILDIGGKWWIIDAEIRRRRDFDLIDSAVVFLPLTKISREAINKG